MPVTEDLVDKWERVVAAAHAKYLKREHEKAVDELSAKVRKVRAEYEALDEIKKILAAAGIRMSVFGCGCCESPHVVFEKDGKVIVDADNFSFTMFE